MNLEDVKIGQRVSFDYSTWIRQHETWGTQWEALAPTLPPNDAWWRVNGVKDGMVTICHFTSQQTLWPVTVTPEWLTLIEQPIAGFWWQVVMRP